MAESRYSCMLNTQVLRKVRESRGLTMSAAARLAGMNVQQWQRIEKGAGRSLTLATLNKIATALGVPAASLLASQGLLEQFVMDGAREQLLRIAAYNLLVNLHRSALPLEMKAIEIFKASGDPHPIRSQEDKPLHVELYFASHHQWNAVIGILMSLRNAADEGVSAAIDVIGVAQTKARAETDDYAKAHQLWVAAGMAATLLNPEYPNDIESRSVIE